MATLQDEEIFATCPKCNAERSLSRLNTEQKDETFSYVCPSRCGAVITLTEVRAGSDLAQAGHAVGKVVLASKRDLVVRQDNHFDITIPASRHTN